MSDAPEDYENPAIVARLARDEGIGEEEARRWFQEMLRFLVVGASSAQPMAPSARVDAAWHVFILHTEAYVAWCDRWFGGYLHHIPTDPRSPARVDSGPSPYRVAKAMMRKRYGSLDPEIWP